MEYIGVHDVTAMRIVEKYQNLYKRSKRSMYVCIAVDVRTNVRVLVPNDKTESYIVIVRFFFSAATFI